MYDQLRILLEVQDFDSEIDKLEKLKSAEPAKLKNLETELAVYKNKVDAKHKAIEELQKQQRDLQMKLSVQQEKITKYKSQRTLVKTNKEYTALELEISESESSNLEMEEEILNQMISIEKAESELRLAEEEFRKQSDIYQEEKGKIVSEVRKINRKIAKINKERSKYTSGIGEVLMTRYENWREKKKTSFVAVIDGQACGGCHLTLPPQLINEVRKKRDLLSCNSCGRVLYWMEDEIPDEDQ